jgi:ADP-ribosylglycohydrolase
VGTPGTSVAVEPEEETQRDRYRGCLIGLAVGDALGAPAEFESRDGLRATYGPLGIVDLKPWGGFPAGTYTDDTQLALATAVGCVQAVRDPLAAVWRHYVAWYAMQSDPRRRRNPGQTCLSALAGRDERRPTPARNDSKGCGAVMRTAPVGLAPCLGDPFAWGVKLGRLTHGHPSGYLPAGFVARLVSDLLPGARLEAAVDGAVAELRTYGGHGETLAKIEQARALAAEQAPPKAAVAALGAGWVGEEALAIALYCALSLGAEFKPAVLAAVNHDGDSDSTASICGAILGAQLGLHAIPGRWIDGVEDAGDILRLADVMWRVFGGGAEW